MSNPFDRDALAAADMAAMKSMCETGAMRTRCTIRAYLLAEAEIDAGSMFIAPVRIAEQAIEIETNQ